LLAHVHFNLLIAIFKSEAGVRGDFLINPCSSTIVLADCFPIDRRQRAKPLAHRLRLAFRSIKGDPQDRIRRTECTNFGTFYQMNSVSIVYCIKRMRLALDLIRAKSAAVVWSTSVHFALAAYSAFTSQDKK